VMAQDNTATITGAVTDANGAAVVGAQVSNTHTQSRQTRRAVTDSQGGYTFSNLAAGHYRIEVVARGLAVSEREISVMAGEGATADFRLGVGTLAESVTTMGRSYEVTVAVTGTRTDTPILDIPQSIQVVSQQVIEDQKPLTLSGILRNVSGFSQTRTDFEVFRSFKLRGFDVLDTTTDGIRNTDSLNIQPDGLANVERVEVLKGPASALYGRGSIGGGINIVTKKPLPDSYREITLNLGSFNHVQPGIDVSGPFNKSKSARYRLIGEYERRESFIDFIEIEKYQIAPSLQFDLGTRSTLTLQSDYRFHKQPRYLGLPQYGTLTGTDDIKLPLGRFLSEPGLDKTKNTGLQSTAILNHRFSADWNGQVAFRWTQNSFFQPTAPPRALQADNRTLNRGFNLFDERERESTIEANTTTRVRWGGIEHKVTTGFDYAWWRYDSRFFSGAIAPINIENPIYGARPTGVFLLADTRDIISSYGLYAQDQMTLLPKLKAVVGGRFDRMRNKNTDFAIPVSGERKDSQFSPRLGLVVEASGNRPGDVVEIGQGKSFKLVADKDRIWVLSPRSRPEGDQDLILYELDPVSLRTLWSEKVNSRPGSIRLSGEGLLLQSPDGRALYAFWNELDSRREFANRLMFSAFDKTTRKWKSPVTVNDDQAATTHSFQGAGVGPDGIIHVAWMIPSAQCPGRRRGLSGRRR
jgi:outer membrane receptor protein involved in Fe transport